MSKAQNKPATIPQEKIEAIETFARDNNLAVLSQHSQIQASIAMSEAIEQMEHMITDEMVDKIKRLEGTKLGFRTDRDDKGGYRPDVIKKVWIEASLKGLYMTGNQVNIIANNLYVTKEGYEFLLGPSRMPDLKQLKMTPGIPEYLSDDIALVPYTASWVYKGEADEIVDHKIPIRANKSMGYDALLGKAKRKMMALIHSRITGTSYGEGDVDDPPYGPDNAKQAEKVNPNATEGPKPGEKPAESGHLDTPTVNRLKAVIETYENDAMAFLVEKDYLQAGDPISLLSREMADRIIQYPDRFKKAVGEMAAAREGGGEE